MDIVNETGRRRLSRRSLDQEDPYQKQPQCLARWAVMVGDSLNEEIAVKDDVRSLCGHYYWLRRLSARMAFWACSTRSSTSSSDIPLLSKPRAIGSTISSNGF